MRLTTADKSSVPEPLVFPPSGDWSGNDGPWSTFWMRIGTPIQLIQVLISTASNQPWAVLPNGCSATDGVECASDRGFLFAPNNSTTWTQNNVTANGVFTLDIEKNLGLSGTGLYGYDTVALSLPGNGTPSLDAQVVAGITTDQFFMGLFGLNPSPSLFSSAVSVPSYMAALKDSGYIPSLSYGYTAGNQYRFDKVSGSLTLGGYDSSLFVPNDLTIAFTQSSSDLTINVNAITIISNGKTTPATSTSQNFPAFIDSTVPYLYLPINVCQAFEDAFGITYDNNTELYLVNETLHSTLVAQNASVVFTLTNITAVTMVEITLPYGAFDLNATYPLINSHNVSRYFPLKRAKDNTQTTLGRAFLQEAYLIADYERSTFSISQCAWNLNPESNIQTISPISSSTISPTKHISTTTIIAIAVAVGSTALIMCTLGLILFLRSRKRKSLPPSRAETETPFSFSRRPKSGITNSILSFVGIMPSSPIPTSDTSPTRHSPQTPHSSTKSPELAADLFPRFRLAGLSRVKSKKGAKQDGEAEDIYELPAMEFAGRELIGDSPVEEGPETPNTWELERYERVIKHVREVSGDDSHVGGAQRSKSRTGRKGSVKQQRQQREEHAENERGDENKSPFGEGSKPFVLMGIGPSTNHVGTLMKPPSRNSARSKTPAMNFTAGRREDVEEPLSPPPLRSKTPVPTRMGGRREDIPEAQPQPQAQASSSRKNMPISILKGGKGRHNDDDDILENAPPPRNPARETVRDSVFPNMRQRETETDSEDWREGTHYYDSE